MKKQLEQLKIKQAVLKAVRKLSGVAFNKKLNGYQLNFSLGMQIGIISMHLNKGIGASNYCDVFGGVLDIFGSLDKSCMYQESHPIKESEIPAFEASVETAIAEIFEFIQGDK